MRGRLHPFGDDQVKLTAKMTTRQRLRWLEETRRFIVKAWPKSTYKAVMKVRSSNSWDKKQIASSSRRGRDFSQ